LTAATLLAAALVYTSFSAASPAVTPRQLLSAAQPGVSYQLTGNVVPGSTRRRDGVLTFRVADLNDKTAVPVRYTGSVPDPFRGGREIIVTVRKDGGVFAGQPGSLVTKCPSRYSPAPPGS
jgi:cytochrome c-type biogenesis protein CcmE